ncbi:hypothetical protein RCH21_001315 [Arthrobacter sp. PL16]|uniref:hypothetical protein n=1 Tax=Arthrobacter TaxID=1663 RepID=UPI0016017058|nr:MULTISPECIES: hypothetical protein [Arthrobacter]MEC5199091.1 hypothetical protein [Arthrobacter sp. PL16]
MSTSVTARPRRARVVTIVWGAVILSIAALLLVSQFVTLSIDPVVVALGLLIGVGLSLVAGGLLSLRGRPERTDQDDTGLMATDDRRIDPEAPGARTQDTPAY